MEFIYFMCLSRTLFTRCKNFTIDFRSKFIILSPSRKLTLDKHKYYIDNIYKIILFG